MQTNSVVLPPVLAKAASDSFNYLLETKSGQQFVFETITVIDSEWIHLNPFESDDPSIRMPGFFAGPLKPDAYVVHERGIDIRLDSIAWVADGKS